jgi:hypothetical protein
MENLLADFEFVRGPLHPAVETGGQSVAIY